jgi:hypothetical protein
MMIWTEESYVFLLMFSYIGILIYVVIVKKRDATNHAAKPTPPPNSSLNFFWYFRSVVRVRHV